VLLALLAAALIFSSSASALEPTHALNRVIKATKTCPLNEPLGIAVNEKTGDIYVTDENEKGRHHLERFNAAGECLKSWAVPFGEQIAVDNSSSPNAGDVYVTGASELEGEEANKVRRYDPEGNLLFSFNKVQISEPEEKPKEFEELFELKGIAVDSTGKLWVYEPFEIFQFNADAKNTYTFKKIETAFECEFLPGLAVTANSDFFYVGRDRELKNETCQQPEETPAMLKLNAETGEPASEPAYNSQLDPGPTRGVAVNQPTGTVYFDDGTSVAAFDSNGTFLERFGFKEPEALSHAVGVTINASTNEVFVTERTREQIEVFSPAGAKEGPKPAPKLPDGREYQLVSPTDKHDGAVLPNQDDGIVRAATDGSAITFDSHGPLVEDPASSRGPEPSQNLSRRIPGVGWETQDLTTPHTRPTGYIVDGTEYRAFSSDLTSAIVHPSMGEKEPHEPPLSPVATETTIYLRNLTGPAGSCEPVPSTCYQPLVSPLNTSVTGFGDEIRNNLAATPDDRHVVFYTEVPLQLAGEPVEGQNPLFEWSAGEGGGTIQNVNVPPPGEPGAGAGAKLGEQLGENGAQGAAGIQSKESFRHAISNDGSRIVWGAEGAVYLRDMVRHETVRLDLPEEGVPLPELPAAAFRIADTSGSRIFFTDNRPLTKDSTSEPEAEPEEGQLDLYACEIVETEGKLGCKLTDLTTTTAAPGESASVQNVVGASEDGTYIYYVADGALAPGAGHGHCNIANKQEEEQNHTPPSSCNLYVQHLGSGGWEAPQFIARITTADRPDWEVTPRLGMTSRVSPNGQFLAFMSNSPLTGYDNVDTNPLANGARDQEVFVYSLGSNTLTCASCNPSGHQPAGVRDQVVSGEGNGLVVDRPRMWEGDWLAGEISGVTSNAGEYGFYLPRNLTDEGRLFFNSADQLVPAVTTPTREMEIEGKSTQVGVMNVYEFEPNKVGSCEQATGCVSLLSGGTSATESQFLEASESGEDAFVYSAARLQPSNDHDGSYDVYDLQVCRTGAPCVAQEPIVPSTCASEPGEPTCKPPATEAPALPPAPPTTGGGPGNKGTVEVLPFTVVKPVPVKPLTTKQKLERALKECRKKKNKKKRHACERQAHKRYPVKKAKKSAKKAARNHR
jgi:DNA-binding beta-propeller fold protein YncE